MFTPTLSRAASQRQDQSSGRGTALAIIVNDTLAVASAAAASSKKRRQSFAGHEHGVARGRVADALAPTRRSRFDRDRFELWRPNDRNGGAVSRTPASEAAGVGQADSTSAAGEKNRRFDSFRSVRLTGRYSIVGCWHASTGQRLLGQPGRPDMIQVQPVLGFYISAIGLRLATRRHFSQNVFPRNVSCAERWRIT